MTQNGDKWKKVEVTKMLSGEYAHTLDDKGRFAMPTRLRDALHDGFVITKGLDGCLYMYEQEQWNILEAKLATLPMSSKSARDFKRFFVGGSVECSYDKQGRVLLPPNLREFAKLDRDIVIAGVGPYAEIWNKAAWDAQMAECSGKEEEIAEQLSEFGI